MLSSAVSAVNIFLSFAKPTFKKLNNYTQAVSRNKTSSPSEDFNFLEIVSRSGNWYIVDIFLDTNNLKRKIIHSSKIDDIIGEEEILSHQYFSCVDEANELLDRFEFSSALQYFKMAEMEYFRLYPDHINLPKSLSFAISNLDKLCNTH